MSNKTGIVTSPQTDNILIQGAAERYTISTMQSNYSKLRPKAALKFGKSPINLMTFWRLVFFMVFWFV